MNFILFIEAHNTEIKELYRGHHRNIYYEEGIDLIFPSDIIIPARANNYPISMGINVRLCDPYKKTNIGCLTIAKSNIFWTPLKVSQVLIGNDEVKVFVDNWDDEEFKIMKGQSYCQILSVTPANISVHVMSPFSKL